MANDITKGVLIVDTATTEPLTTKTFTAVMVRWVGATLAGHTVSVQDANGNIRWASEASGANYVEETHFDGKPLIFEGLQVPTLSSGTIYVYVFDAVPIRT